MPLPIKKIKTKPSKTIHFQLVPANENDLYQLAPIENMVAYDGKKIYFSKVFKYADYPVIVAYLDNGKDKQLQPCIFYFSNSFSIWRVAPWISQNMFGKGLGEFSCDLPPMLNLTLIDFFKKEIELNLNDLPLINEALVEACIGEKMTSMQKFMNQCKFGARAGMPQIFEISENSKTLTFVNQDAQIDAKKIKQDTKALPNLVTNDNTAIVESTSFKNVAYRNILEGPMTIVCCSSKDGKFQYLIGIGKNIQTQKSQCFLLSVTPQPPHTNDFCVSSITANLGYQNVTPLMRVSNIDMLTLKLDNHFGKYCDCSSYVDTLPLNQLLNQPPLYPALLRLQQEASMRITKDESSKTEESIVSAVTNIDPELIEKYIEDLENFVAVRQLQKEGMGLFTSKAKIENEISAATKMLHILRNDKQKITPFTNAELKEMRMDELAKLIMKYKPQMEEMRNKSKLSG